MCSSRSNCNRKYKQKSHQSLDKRIRIQFQLEHDRPHELQTIRPQYPRCETFYRRMPWYVQTECFSFGNSFGDLIFSFVWSIKVSINSSSTQQRHHFNQNVQTQGVKQSSNQQPCIIVANRSWPTGSTASKSVSTSLLHSNAIYLPSPQSFAAIANLTPSPSGSSGSGGVSLLNTSQNQKSISNDTIIIPQALIDTYIHTQAQC